MLSLVFSLCIAGEPCKEKLIAEFYTEMSTTMCATNKKSMTASLSTRTKEEAAASKFECRETEGYATEHVPFTELKFVMNDGGKLENMRLAKFYGMAAPYLCSKNREYYEGVLLDSAKTQNATGTVSCEEIIHSAQAETKLAHVNVR